MEILGINNLITKISSHFRGRRDELWMKYFLQDVHISHISMFHNITKTNLEIQGQDDCRIEDMMNYIRCCQELCMEFVSLDKLFSLNVEDASRNKAVITFDDGYESVSLVAAKILTDKNIPFTCFITTSFIGKEGYISIEQLKNLSDNPLCTIGMHSDQHIFWRNKSSKELENDYIKCRRILADIIGYEPCYYAFPYGSVLAVSKKNIRVIKKLSPRAIFLTDQRKIVKGDLMDPLSGLPRIDIPGYYKGYYKKDYIGLDLRKI